MLSEDKLKRLNELARKAKKNQLSEAELNEQKQLRDEYIKQFRIYFRHRLENIVFVDETGKEIKKPVQ